MRVLIVGGGGMLGHKVYETLSRKWECFATQRTTDGPWRSYPCFEDRERILSGVEVTNTDTVTRAFSISRPDVVVNCVGIIKQKKEASDAQLSIRVNSLFPHQLAELSAAVGARLIHFSTDCVFSGKKGDYSENDPADATDLYGRSKYLGEVDRPGCLTIRTSIIGWDLTKSDGLLEWFRLQRGSTIAGYLNAVFSGLSTSAIAHLLAKIIETRPQMEGLYHVAAEPISKFDLLDKLNQSLGLGITLKPAEEPRVDRSLNATRFEKEAGLSAPNWDKMVAGLAEEHELYDRWRKSR